MDKITFCVHYPDKGLSDNRTCKKGILFMDEFVNNEKYKDKLCPCFFMNGVGCVFAEYQKPVKTVHRSDNNELIADQELHQGDTVYICEKHKDG